MTVGPAFFGNSYAPGVLDAYTANLWTACGLNRLIANYPTGVTASNGTSASAISFNSAGTDLDTAALLAHAPTTGTASFTDQSGGGHSFGNGIAESRVPLIVSGGSYLGLFRFDGTDDSHQAGGTFGGGTGATIFMRGRLRSTSAAQILIELSALWSTNDGLIVYHDNAISRFVVGSRRNTGAQFAISEFNVSATTEAVWCFRFDRTQMSGANQCVMFANGTKQTRTGSTGETGTVPSGNFGTHTMFLAARNNTQFYSSLDLKNLVIYNTALSDADCTAISALL